MACSNFFQKIVQEEIIAEAELLADSLMPAEEDFTVYRDMLQAKLDSLRRGTIMCTRTLP